MYRKSKFVETAILAGPSGKLGASLTLLASTFLATPSLAQDDFFSDLAVGTEDIAALARPVSRLANLQGHDAILLIDVSASWLHEEVRSRVLRGEQPVSRERPHRCLRLSTGSEP